MFSSKLLLAVVAALVVVGASARAAIDFTGLGGTYVGTYTLGLDSEFVTGRVTVTVTVPENGKKATLEILGPGTVASSPDVQVALLGKHTFRSNRSVSSNNALFAMFQLLPALPTKFSGNEKRFSFALSSTVSGTTGSVVYTVTANGKRLKVTGAGLLGAAPITVSLSAKKKGN